MNSTKNAWLSYLTSHRHSRRTDMRHYMTLFRATLLTIIIAAGSLFVNEDFSNWRVLLFAIVLGSFLIYSASHFLGEYLAAERQIKRYSDAIDLVFMSKPQSNDEYRTLFYLVIFDKYTMQTELGKFLSRQKYLISGFPMVGSFMTQWYFKKHGNEVPFVKACYTNPQSIWNTLNFAPENPDESIHSQA